LDLSVFTEQGYGVTSGDIDVKLKIQKEDVLVEVNFPITFSSGDATVSIEDFSSSINFPLDKLFSLAVDITNNEITNGFFDKDEWMIQHGPKIVIDKHRPYPHIVYVLTTFSDDLEKNSTFQFAIKGFETVGKEIINRTGQIAGCCTNSVDNFCYKNTPENQCSGVYDNNLECGCNEIVQTKNEGCCVIGGFFCQTTSEEVCNNLDPGESEFIAGDLQCQQSVCFNNNCPKTFLYNESAYNGPPKEHGESWCVYDAVAGKGFDYVGSRHYLHTCIDGQEIVEECRDFREELCTEQNNIVSTPAGDRVFTKANCRINRWYDCALQDRLNTTAKNKAACLDTSVRDCHWLDDRLLNRSTRCVPNVPPGFKFWELEENGKWNGEDICSFASENPASYFRDQRPKTWGHSNAQFCQRMGDCGNYRNIADEITKFGYFNPLGVAEDWIYLDPGNTNKGNEFVIDLPLNTRELAVNVSIPKGPFGSYAVCETWIPPPNVNNCELCDAHGFKPCTEYRCRSLGINCVYSEENGNPSCGAYGTGDTISPKITFDKTKLKPGFSVNIISSLLFPGKKEHKITPKVKAYEEMTLGITTSEETRCGISLGTTSVLPNLFFSSDFRESHEITLRIPDTSDFGNQKQFKLLVICQDKAGNQNEDVFVIHVDLDLITQVVPEIVDTDPRPETLEVSDETVNLKLYVNKPFNDCRYSDVNLPYEFMESFACSTTIQEIRYDPFTPLGTFICSSQLKINYSNFFFNCEDERGIVNPENYAFAIS